jgi:beta-lactamase regulating signal transducer with metallopeptidase domain
MVEHERAHVASRDNLKRLVLRGCPRLPFSSLLDTAWSMAAEEAADARAAGDDPGRRLDLAHALIRLARLAPVSNLPAGVSAFYPGGSVENRVRLLLDPPVQTESTNGCLLIGAVAAVLAAGFIVSAPVVHVAMEALVRLVL